MPEDGGRAMAMDAVLKQLEDKIETLLKAFQAAQKKEDELNKRIEELEGRLAAESEAGDRISELEKQRKDLGKRLEKVLSMIDGALEKGD